MCIGMAKTYLKGRIVCLPRTHTWKVSELILLQEAGSGRKPQGLEEEVPTASRLALWAMWTTTWGN